MAADGDGTAVRAHGFSTSGSTTAPAKAFHREARHAAELHGRRGPSGCSATASKRACWSMESAVPKPPRKRRAGARSCRVRVVSHLLDAESKKTPGWSLEYYLQRVRVGAGLSSTSSCFSASSSRVPTSGARSPATRMPSRRSTYGTMLAHVLVRSLRIQPHSRTKSPSTSSTLSLACTLPAPTPARSSMPWPRFAMRPGQAPFAPSPPRARPRAQTFTLSPSRSARSRGCRCLSERAW